MQTTYFFDFDNTFIRTETLDILADIALAGHPEADRIRAAIAAETEAAMAGKADYHTSLQQRLAMLPLTRAHIHQAQARLPRLINPSIAQHQSFFTQHAEHIYIVSGGFAELIIPTVAPFGIPATQVLANRLHYDYADNVCGLDADCPLAHSGGKSKTIAALNHPGTRILIGDGYTDYEAKRDGAVSQFFAYTESITRPEVTTLADAVLPDMEAFLHSQTHLTPSAGTPPVLLLENIHPLAVTTLAKDNLTATTLGYALSDATLPNHNLQDIQILGIRSKTKITPALLDTAPNLSAIGAFCIGTQQIDLEACSNRGIAVFNAPYSNTRSVVELALGCLIMLARRIPDKNTALHAGAWQKSSHGAHEVRHKRLGIIGYGNIGAQFSVLAEALGLQVFYYDIIEKLPLGNAKKCDTLAELLSRVDIVSLHVDGRPSNHHLLDTKQLQQMQPGALLLNLSRGHVVNIEATAAALQSGHLGGAAFDVFPNEPAATTEPIRTPLQNLPNVILTPHIGGSTEEAQAHIGQFVADRLLAFTQTGSTTASVNLPELSLPPLTCAQRILHIHRNVPGVLAALNHIFEQQNINVDAQYLKTRDTLGYAVTDISSLLTATQHQALLAAPNTLKVKLLT